MEDEDIVGKEFTCFKFETDEKLSYSSSYEELLGLPAKVINIHHLYRQYANAEIINSSGQTCNFHYPTDMIKEQLIEKEQEKLEETSIDEIIINMKQLISKL